MKLAISFLLFITASAFAPQTYPGTLSATPSKYAAAHACSTSRRTGGVLLFAKDRKEGGGQVSEAMRKKLTAESAAPLRLPLMYASAVLFGKGSTDGIITVLKSVSGVSKEPLSEHAVMFGVDAVFLAAGVALGLRASEAWKGCLYNPTTWKLGKPWFLQSAATPEILTQPADDI
eukprot:CAMPEP_0173065802 /NCGR_PEP_ID=MMETSP1102-20130122/5822_1 /TAXON_ID=49646 /ORGANISM="Geminigera sp., Strain Caron Lab Isolate" /LENGTH=174 /DNA_ID=CAMNT_0013933117 /DNA_START=181 /DNA_END=705 /DNA_ORIENTATION=-